MKKTIRKIVSKVLATVTAIATLASPLAPSITVHAEESIPVSPAEYSLLTLENTECSVSDGALYIDHIKNTTVDISIQTSILSAYNEANDTTLTALRVNSTAFNDLSGTVQLGEGVGFDTVTGQSNITAIDFEGNNMFKSSTLEDVFKDASKLETVTGFANVINAANNSDVSMIKTFNNCESLETVDIDLTSSSKTLRLNSTFNNCPSLETVTFTNANFKDMLYLTGYAADGTYPESATFDFNQCYFPSVEDDTFDNVFKNFTGTINLDGCSCVSSDVVFGLKKFVAGPSEAVGDLILNFTDSKIGEIDNLINGGSYNNVTLVSVIGDKTEIVNTIFGSNTEVSGNVSVSNNSADSLKELVAPYYGLNMDNENAEVTAVDSLLRSLDLTGIEVYNTIGHTYNANYSDLSDLDLNQSADAVYYETSSDLSFDSYYLPEKFVTAKSFGGTYYLPFEAWEVLGEENFSKVEEDGIVDIPLANRDSSTIKGHQYDNGSLKNDTEYTHSKATVKFTDVYTDTTRTTYCAGGTVITSVLGYDEDINYFTDESLETPFVAEGFIVEEDTVLQLYYTTEEGAGGIEPDDGMIDKQLSITFVNAESSDIPNTLSVSWRAIGGTVADSGTTSITVDKTKTTQTITVPVPSVVEGITELTYEFTIADVEGFEITKASDGITFTLTKTATTPPDILEPIVEDIPEGVSINFGIDIEDITATLADGTTKPLGSDDTSLIVSVEPEAQTVYQSPRNQTFDEILFYDVNLTLTDGTNEWEVKSIDSPMGIAIPIPSDCGSTTDIKVWHYDNGIMTEPTEVQNKSVTSTHIIIPTTSYSYYAVSYNVGDTEQKTITINWDDEDHESERPTSVVADWTATYADDSTEEGTVVFNRDNTVDRQTTTINVPKSNSGSSLVSTAANIRAVTGYEVVTTPGDPLTFTLRYVGNTASYVTVTFGVELLNTPTGTALPNTVPLTVYTWYTDGTKDTYNTTIDIGSDGTGSKAVERPIKNADGSSYLRTTWLWGDVDGYTLTNKTSYAVYEYDGSSTSIQTVYPVTIKFNGDSTDKTKRPTSLTVTWTATTNTSNTVSTGTANVNITNASDSFSQNITIPDTTGEQRTVTFTGPVLEGYNMNVNGSTITYTYNVKTATNTSYEIIFDDEDNKSGRRPAELTVTFADTTNSSNTITSKITIAENTTTKVKTYKGNISIPAGTTYAITKVETLPDGYKASISGLSATLKYTPEKINKTFKIEWKNDVEDVRPSSVTVKVKSGDIEGATLTLKKDTNWAASTDLLKYIKGVEANWTAEASSVTNYSASVSGETITMTYTGTLTEAQKEAINATDKDGSEEEKEQLYDFEKFDWIDYANRYPDVKKAFGYNKEALYAHYIHYGIAEGRIATWTGKYENVNEDILKAYFPNDYKYKVENSSSADQMLEDMGGGTSNSTNSSDKSNVTVDENGNTIIKTDNGDGTTTETVIDKDGNVVQTKTYATGDNRMASMTWIYFAIIAVALCLGVVCYRDFRVSDKNRKFVDSHLKS